MLNDITIKKRFELLPYIAGNLSGIKPSRNASLDYDTLKPNAGLGLNIDLNKNSGLEITLNPDFSWSCCDISQIFSEYNLKKFNFELKNTNNIVRDIVKLI